MHCKTDLQALYLSGTYCHKTGKRPPRCTTPQEPTKYYYSSPVIFLSCNWGLANLFLTAAFKQVRPVLFTLNQEKSNCREILIIGNQGKGKYKKYGANCSELVYTVVNGLLAILYYSIGLKSHLLVTQFPQI